MNIALVTGGAGFVGSHIVATLLAQGRRVRSLDNLSTGSTDNWSAAVDDAAQATRVPASSVAKRFEKIVGDIRELDDANAACRDVDFVIHQAALASVPRSVDDPLATHRACADGTLVMLDAARRAGAKRFVYAASSSAYGDQAQPAKSEELLPRPLSPYAAAKLAGEHYCQAFWRTYGFPAVSLRYFNVFGPRQDPAGPYAAVIPRFIDALARGESPTIYGDGRQTRDFTYAANVAQANLLAAEAPAEKVGGETFNIAGGRAVDLLELLARIGELMGVVPTPKHEAARAGDVRDSLADISKARRVLGFEPTIDLGEGLRRTIAWWRTRG